MFSGGYVRSQLTLDPLLVRVLVEYSARYFTSTRRYCNSNTILAARVGIIKADEYNAVGTSGYYPTIK